ncbi:hypothetical protein FSP39_009037 [Pinctada imbricata]|uniref:SH3 domain-containing protein n=1 Tax=Pinctada imbricata TaxID=66713 RepID=A0AA88XFK4_PINIB|nr:hypothetical protein FSP39_009037 [Pinctada imbricata]
MLTNMIAIGRECDGEIEQSRDRIFLVAPTAGLRNDSKSIILSRFHMAKIEKQYYTDLQKLAESSKFKTELGDLEKAWRELKNETEKTAQAHEKASKDFERLGVELATFTDEQRKEVKHQEDIVVKAHNCVKSAYSKAKNQEKVFHKKCEEWDELQNQVKFNTNNNNNMNTKDFDKLKVKEIKAKEDMEKNDNIYKNLIEEVQRAKQTWEGDFEHMCDIFQSLDEKRIEHVRDWMWKCTNVDSQTCVDQDDSCERVRNSLERCDITADTNHFVSMYKTGERKPPPFQYATLGKLSVNRTLSNSPGLPPPPNRPPPHPKDATYAEISDSHRSCITSDDHIAVMNYKPKQKGEIAMTTGDHIAVLRRMEDNGMVFVHNTRTKESGYVPMGNMELKDCSAFSF